MKYIVNVLSVLFFGWPSLVIGYIATAIKSGFDTGVDLYNRHEVAAIDKFVKKVGNE